VKELVKQCENLDIQFQILVYDDGSNEKYKKQNEEIQHEFGVNYLEMSENLGRSKIRNRLARTAMFKNFLFLDGDSTIIRDDFVKKYIDSIGKAHILYGGRVYQDDKPSDKKLLHWKYGRKREALSAAKRQESPYLNFQSNNFMIDMWHFERFQFDESISGYGYEDLVFAEELCKNRVSVLHIDNPVLHDGLEDNKDFVTKNLKAISNLYQLVKENKIEETRLTKFFNSSSKNGLLFIVKLFYGSKLDSIKSALISGKSNSVRKFNLLKLLYYAELVSKK